LSSTNQNLANFAKSSAVYGLGSMLQRFVGLLLLPVFTHYLTPKEYGTFALLTILGAFTLPIFSLGINAAMGPSYFKAKTDEEKQGVTWTALIIVGTSASILLALAWSLPELFLKCALLSSEHSLLASLFLTGTAANVVVAPLTQKIQFDNQAKRFVWITAVNTLVIVTLNIATVVFLGYGILGMVFSQAIGSIFSLITFFIGSQIRLPTQFSKTAARNILKVGIPLMPSFAFLFIMANAGRYGLQYFQGESAVGTYTAGFQIGTAINMLVGAFATAWYPFFMSYIEKQEEAAQLFGKITTYYVLFAGLLCLLCFSCADIIMHIMTAPTYYEARKIIGFISVAFVFTGLFKLLLPPVYYSDRIQIVSIVQASAALVAALVAVLLCSTFGIYGAALSMVAGHAIMAIGMHLYNRTSRHLLFRIQYEWSPILKFATLAATIVLLSFYPTTPDSRSFILKPLILVTASFFSLWLCLDKSSLSTYYTSLKSLVRAR